MTREKSEVSITYVLGSSWGGIPHYTAELANSVSEYADVSLIKPKDDNNDLFSDSINIYEAYPEFKIESPTSAKNFMSLPKYRNISIIDKICPDIVHFTEIIRPYMMPFVHMNRTPQRYKSVITPHHAMSSYTDLFKHLNETEGPVVASLETVNRWFYRKLNFDRYISHTDSNRDELIRCGVPEDSVYVIPHGAFSMFNDGHTNDSEIGKNVLFFGYIRETKGLDTLIKGAEIAANEIDNLSVTIAGEGDLEKYINNIRDDSIFNIRNEYIPDDDVSELFNWADIVALPYTSHNGHSGVLTIAFSFGVPIITSQNLDLPVTDGEEGLTVPPGDPEAFAGAIVRILQNNNLQKRLSQNSKKRSEDLSWDSIARKHMSVYEQM